MNLARIIAELRVELQCVDAAIASIEELARVQDPDGDMRPDPPSGAPAAGETVPEGAAPVKRPRGRPRKTPQSMDSAAVPPSDDSSVTAV